MTGKRLRAFRLAIVLAVGATALIAGGCGSSTKTSTASATRSSTTRSITTTAPADPGTAAGGGLSADAVAVAAGTPITHAAFEHWLAIAAKSEAAASSTKVPPVDPSDPPDFNNCIAQARHYPSLAKTSRQELKADCSQLFRTLSAQVMSFLIESDWYLGYAARLRLVPSNAQVAGALNAAKAKQFPTEAGFRAFLEQTGQTVADVRFRFEINLIAARLAARHKGTQSAKTAAVASEIKRAFLSSTVCTPLVLMADCGNYHAPG